MSDVELTTSLEFNCGDDENASSIDIVIESSDENVENLSFDLMEAHTEMVQGITGELDEDSTGDQIDDALVDLDCLEQLYLEMLDVIRQEKKIVKEMKA